MTVGILHKRERLEGAGRSKARRGSDIARAAERAGRLERLDKALLAAIEKCDMEEARKLIARGADPNAKREIGQVSALLLAIGKLDAPMIGLLLQQGADPDARLFGDRRALMVCAINGFEDTASMLIGAGASLDAKDDEGRSALHHAAIHGRLGILRLLTDSGARVDTQDHTGESPLMASAIRGDAVAVGSLLVRGADPDLRDNEGYSALMYACLEGWEETARMLLRAKAETGFISIDEGENAYDMAIMSGLDNVAAMIKG